MPRRQIVGGGVTRRREDIDLGRQKKGGGYHQRNTARSLMEKRRVRGGTLPKKSGRERIYGARRLKPETG